MQNILNYIFQIFSSFSPAILFLCVIFFGMFVFWRGAMETHKDRSSIFDMFLISIFVGLIVGRIIFIISNWDHYALTWSWLPYEKYGNDIYLFRLLPWNFLNIFDGGLNILAMFVGYLFCASTWSTFFKKWRWNHLFPTIYLSGEVMLAISFLLIGLASATPAWIYEGLVLLIFPIISLILINYVNKIEDPQKEKRIYLITNIILILISCGVVGYIYISGGVDIYEKICLYALFIWVATGIIFFIRDLKRANIVIEKVSSVRGFEVNSPIKLP